MSRITMADIAESVGVDRSTVSSVLNNKTASRGISAELAKRIVERARELNYVPNTFARAIREGRFNTAALILSTIDGRSYLSSRLLDGINDGLSDASMHLTVAKVPDEKLNDAGYAPTILRTFDADGIILNYTPQLSDRLIQIVDQHKIPAVWMNAQREADAVYPNNFAAARSLTQRMVALGHRRIAYVDLCAGKAQFQRHSLHFSTVDRYAGYATVMKESGLEAMEIRPENGCVTFEEERAFMLDFLRQPNRPTAVICYFSVFVPALLRAARELGLRIPEQLSVATFAPEAYREHGLTVSAMLEPHYWLGQEAVRLLRRRIEQPKIEIPSVCLGFNWLDMDTCVPLQQF